MVRSPLSAEHIAAVDRPVHHKGRPVFSIEPRQLAVGKSLVGIVVKGRDLQGPQMMVEKVEVHVESR